jgi:hypothetical protein
MHSELSHTLARVRRPDDNARQYAMNIQTPRSQRHQRPRFEASAVAGEEKNRQCFGPQWLRRRGAMLCGPIRTGQPSLEQPTRCEQCAAMAPHDSGEISNRR